MEVKKKKLNPIKTNLWVDVVIFLAFLLALDPRTTGIAIHEWLSLAAAGAAIVHLLLHWQWIVEVTRRFFRHFGKKQSLNYVVNALFFIDLAIVIFSGIMISKEVLPALGLSAPHNNFMRRLHTLSADWFVFIVGLHIALHWKWLLSAFKRYLVPPVLKLFKPSRTAPALASSHIALQEGDK